MWDNVKFSKTGADVTNNIDFHHNVGEADCELCCGCLDPVLKLCTNCELMPTRNDDVNGDKANETRMVLKQVVLKSEQNFKHNDKKKEH